MAIAFNLPSEREATEENFSRLNRLLAELYEVLCRILVSRQPGQEAQETRRERPYSESDVERQRPTPQASTSCRRSASSPPLTLGLDGDLDDDVFIGPRADSGNDLFSTRNLEIFGFGSTRTPAGVLLIPQREGSFTFTVTSEKHWQDKGGTAASEAAANAENTDTDVTDAAASENPADPDDKEESPETSIFSSIIPDKVAGSICTAILLMLGWKLLSQR